MQDKEFISHKEHKEHSCKRGREQRKYLWVKLKTKTKQIKRDFPEILSQPQVSLEPRYILLHDPKKKSQSENFNLK